VNEWEREESRWLYVQSFVSFLFALGVFFLVKDGLPGTSRFVLAGLSLPVGAFFVGFLYLMAGDVWTPLPEDAPWYVRMNALWARLYWCLNAGTVVLGLFVVWLRVFAGQ